MILAVSIPVICQEERSCWLEKGKSYVVTEVWLDSERSLSLVAVKGLRGVIFAPWCFIDKTTNKTLSFSTNPSEPS